MNSERIRPSIRYPGQTVSKAANTDNNPNKNKKFRLFRKKRQSHDLSAGRPIISGSYKGNYLDIVV